MQVTGERAGSLEFKETRGKIQVLRLGVSILYLILLSAGGCISAKKPIPRPLARLEAIEQYNQNVAAIMPFKAKVFEWEFHITTPSLLSLTTTL